MLRFALLAGVCARSQLMRHAALLVAKPVPRAAAVGCRLVLVVVVPCHQGLALPGPACVRAVRVCGARVALPVCGRSFVLHAARRLPLLSLSIAITQLLIDGVAARTRRMPPPLAPPTQCTLCHVAAALPPSAWLRKTPPSRALPQCGCQHFVQHHSSCVSDARVARPLSWQKRCQSRREGAPASEAAVIMDLPRGPEFRARLQEEPVRA